MTAWIEGPLGDFIELKRGYDLPTQDRIPGPYPVVSSSGPSGWNDRPKVTAPGVVTGRYGTLGAVFYVEDDFWPLNTTLYVRDFKGNDPRFVSYFLRTFDFTAYSDKAAVPGVNRNALHESRVSFPPPPEQRAIAGVLGALDDKIELNRRMNETLDELAQTHFQGASSMAASVPLGELVAASRDGVDPGAEPDEHFEHFSIPAYDNGATPVLERGSAIKSGKLAIPEDSVLVSKLNPRIPRVWLPDLGETRRPICSTEFLVLVPKDPVSREYVYCLTRSSAFQEDLAGRVAGTSGSHQRVKAADALTIEVPRLDEDSLTELTTMLRPLLARAAAATRESRTLAELRDALLPKLISGELRVRDLNNSS
ncbi:MAG: restriction endonuclease subunit S [Gaiellaceae bacterium]